MAEDQVSQQGDQGNLDLQTQTSLGWRAALSDEWKEHEFVKDCQKPTDFVKKAYGLKTELDSLSKFKTEKDALEAKLAKAIIKPGEKATAEEISAYRKTMDLPDKPEGYEFPQAEGMENSPEMVSWAQKLFHRLDIPKVKATEIGKEWNSFIAGMVEAENKMAEDEKVANEKKFREQFKTDDEYKAGMELAKRFWKKITNTEFDEAYKETEAWQLPLFMNFIFNTAKAVGEDFSPGGKGAGGGTEKPGLVYDKTPKE